MSESHLALISCGDFALHNSLSDVFKVIQNKIESTEDRIKQLEAADDISITLLGPFYARTLLESVCMALVGRIDPFRLLFLQKVQMHDSYGLGSRSSSAINWFGDIIEEGLKQEERQLNKMFNPNKKFNSIGRGLLGDYYGEIYWNQAYKKLLDYTEENPTDLLDKYRVSTEPEKFILHMRQEASKLFSSLSKGVHSEIVVKPEIIYDKTTVFELISDTILLCGILSLVSHNIDTSICKLPLDNALVNYREIKEWGDDYGV